MKAFQSNNFSIVHIFNDDKFIDFSIELFEKVIPDSSRYYILKTKNEPLKFVASLKAEPIIITSEIDIANFKTRVSKETCHAVFFHALNPIKINLFDCFSNNVVKVWFSWGFDLYPKLKNYDIDYFEPFTRRFLNENKPKLDWKKKLIKSRSSLLLYELTKDKKNSLLPNKLKNILENEHKDRFYEVIKEVDVFVPVIPEEIKLLSQFNINPIYAPYTYGHIKSFLNGDVDRNVLESRNILIGNSADPTNNHVDVFKKLANFNLEGRSVYVPLNYGGNKAYIDFVIENGKRYLKDSFHPLVKFLPLEKYNTIVSSCGFIIFNHLRQQGLGNIISAGYLGGKIFLNSKSPVYKFYKNLGMNIYKADSFNEDDITVNLTQEDFEHNRKLFLENYSELAVLNKVEELVSIVKSSVPNYA